MQYKTQIRGITHSAVDRFITFVYRISSKYCDMLLKSSIFKTEKRLFVNRTLDFSSSKSKSFYFPLPPSTDVVALPSR